MDKPPFSLAFVMLKESFVLPARLFDLASDANKNKPPPVGGVLVARSVAWLVAVFFA